MNLKNKNQNLPSNNNAKKKNDSFYSKLEKLSYEESLNKLDDILNKLQSENFIIEDLQQSYQEASLYLKHCEKLLSNIEQEIITIDPNQIE
ncbi:exodeoxyribonuclease VII small subunit [Prochlorococcus marinus]|uniref:exodeoxyribonuclease VII small subunit n=1 Tax=Prochlorococcus marinus TaxID=1219 RepID=UPI0022B2BD57|nr:exodeoxyribonuclease VII small subunit [Prochlorococcus marinus]